MVREGDVSDLLSGAVRRVVLLAQRRSRSLGPKGMTKGNDSKP